MSLKSLLEMDDLVPAEKDVPKPKPRPRAVKATMLSTVGKRSSEKDDDWSITSMESGNNNGTTSKKRPQYSPSPKHLPSSKSRSAFHNAAFVNDDDSEHPSEPSASANLFKPKPLKRNSLLESPSLVASNKVGGDSRRGSIFKVNSYDVDSDENENIPIVGGGRSSPPKDDGDADDTRSDATFVIENEKDQETVAVSEKQLKLNKSPSQTSRIPRPQQRKSVRVDGESSASQSTPSKERSENKPKVEGQSPTNSDKKREHLAVQMEDNENDGTSSIKEAAADESEATSVSSSAAPPTAKTSKMSRFGKLFGSSSTDSKKSKNTDNKTLPDKNSARPEGASEDEKGARSLVFRWKKTAHTFLRAPPKPIDEESVSESKEEEENVPDTSTRSGSRRKSTDTRIMMPDSAEESEGSDGKSDTEVEREPEPLQKKSKEDEIEKQVDHKRSRYRSFGKLLRSMSKEKEEKSPKSKAADDNAALDLSRDDATLPTGKVKGKKSKILLMPKLKKEEVPKARSRSRSRSSASSAAEEKEVSQSESESEVEEAPAISAKAPKSPTKKAKHAPESPVLIDSESGKELLFGVTLHSTDLLPLDPNVIHPVVKVTVMFQNGQYMKRSALNEMELESPSKKGRKGEKKSKQSKKKKKEATEGTENVSESILPIMSQPCQARHSIPTFAPTWNELVVFEESFKRFVTRAENEGENREPILLFELMDFLPMTSNGASMPASGFHGSDIGWYKIAWAFLKPISSNGVPNVNRKIRLQLYKPLKLRPKEKVPGPEVYSWWRSGKREKVSATLYITPKGIRPPETRTASLRQLLSMRKEHLTQAILDSQLATRKTEKAKRPSLYELREQANWSRMEGQSCKPPNKLVISLPSSQIESLNIVISGNVQCTKFSPCGLKLAAGLDTDELHVILVFEVPSWTLLKSLKGHHGIIYEIAWKMFELDDETSYHYLASASADATVRIWKMDNHDEKSLSLFKILYHPSYVYCVKFHPTHPSLLASGCYDGIIRIWDIKPEHALDLAEKKKGKDKKIHKRNEMSPVILLDKHNNFVNCLLFDKGGQYLYSGDGSGCLFKWSFESPTQRRSWRLERDAKLHHGDVPVNSIDLHPSSNRILVHLRDNFIKILDAAKFIPLQTFSGLQNEKYQIRSCFSPCGNLVMSGSEQNTLCIWDADTGKILQFINIKSHPNCTVTCVDYHPFDYYLVAGIASLISEPSPLLIYFHHQPSRMNYPLLKKTAMKMRESLEKSRSQSTESGERAFPSPRRGNSTEKFVSIIQKLDSALYLAQQRSKKREQEMQSPACTSTSSTFRKTLAQNEITAKGSYHSPFSYQVQNESVKPSPSARKRREEPKSEIEEEEDNHEKFKIKVSENNGNNQLDPEHSYRLKIQMSLTQTQNTSGNKEGRARVPRQARHERSSPSEQLT